MNGNDDDGLLARLRAADPASSLPPADPERVTDLLEAAMGETTTRTPESRDTGTRDRSPLTWLVAAAAVVLIVATAAFALVNRDHGTTATAAPTVTRLGYALSPGRCLQPTPAVLGQQTIAFQGTLASRESGTATFRVTTWYRGGPTDLVQVTAAVPSQLASLEGLARLVPGDAYLVAANAGQVAGCGLTGPDTEARVALYDQAFGG